jgi:LPS sulfotransferase NodH
MSGREPSIVLLLAQERSGTHFLRSILTRTRRIVAPGEVCNASADISRPSKISFFEFRRSYLTGGTNSPFPTAETQRRFIDEYFTYVISKYIGHDYIMLDIKYSHVHNFNSFWWDFSARPFLLRYARKRQVKIIHLVRENIFQTALSCLYAAESGVWRASSPDQLKRITITVAPELLRRRIDQIGRSIALFDDWLLGCDCMRITYEALSGSSPEAPLKELSAFLGFGEVIPFKPGFVKTTPPYDDCIANWGEIQALGAPYCG